MSYVPTRNLTTLDFFKAAAVVIMIIDHIGLYFFPDQVWWRVVGRAAATWYFLIGHSRSRDLSAPIWIGAIGLLLVNMIVGLSVFPLNSLFVIIVIRILLDPIADFAFRAWENLFLVFFLLVLLFPAFQGLLENSTVCLYAALIGFYVRHRRDGDRSDLVLFNHPQFPAIALAVTMLVGPLSQMISLPSLTFAQGLVLCAGMGLNIYLFMYARMTEYPALTARWPGWVVRLIQFGGRRTLEIYVGHLILFKLICFMLAQISGEPSTYGLFAWDWHPGGRE